jgi:hypothetical protein
MEITVTIHTPELAQAIQSLASAIKAANGAAEELQTQASFTQAPVQPVQQLASTLGQTTYTQPQTPTQQAVPAQPMQSAVPVQQPAQQPASMPGPVRQAVPVTAPAYTMEQLSIAAIQLMDAGKKAELLQLLQQFGVPALTELQKEQYGAFATALRRLGAKI